MPLVDLACDKCMIVFTDEIVRNGDPPLECDQCGDSLRRLFSGNAVAIGALHSKPIVFKQIGRVFETNAEQRDYFRANPNLEVISKNDSAYASFYGRVREANEVTSRGMGYRDWDHRQLSKRQDRKKAASV